MPQWTGDVYRLAALDARAHDHPGPVTQHPAGVQLFGLGVGRDVNGRVVDADDLAVDLHRMGHEHLVRADAHDALRDRRLAGAGRPVEEHGAVGVDGGAELVEELVGDDEIGERRLQHLAVDLYREALAGDDVAIELERDRTGPGVAGLGVTVGGVLLA